MAIEIRELLIRAVVAPDEGGESAAAGGAQQDMSQDDIVAECVEQVLDVLRLKEER